MLKHLSKPLALAACLALPAAAMEAPMHAGELAHEVDRLAHAGRVLYVAAHPDDENTRLLAHLANHRHLTVAYLSMTRGGGGQNLVGTEQGELLDVIRTEELLAARRIDRARQLFTRMRDFGYSKTAEETFANWGHEEALSDVVRAVREFQPDVIIARFAETPPNHGHHTASAILAREAFTAAADPSRFPGQIAEGLKPWQATRLLRNVSTWGNAPIPEGALPLDVGAYDARLGMSYGELAALSRSRHVSQGFGVAGERGPVKEHFVTVAGTPPQTDILDGVDPTWRRYGAVAEPLQSALDDARAALLRDEPERALPALLRAHRAFEALPDDPRVRDARRSADRVIAAAAGLFARATSPVATAVPGAEVPVSVELVLRRPAEVVLRSVSVPGAEPAGAEAPGPRPLAVHEKLVVSRTASIPADAAPSSPYWLAEPSLPGRQVVSDESLLGRPSSPPALVATAELGFGDRVVRLKLPVVHAWVEPERGELVRPFLIVPPLTITPERQSFLFPNGRTTDVVLRIRAGSDGAAGTVRLPLPSGWPPSAPVPVRLPKAGDEIVVRIPVTPPEGARPATIAPVVTVDGRDWSVRESVIDHEHVPYQLVLQPSRVRLVPLSLKLPDGRVGYVPGSGDSVAADLAHAGLRIETIDEATLGGGDLSAYDAILVGIRAFNVRDDARAALPRLLRWVEEGGTLVVQYNTNNRLAALDAPIGPFPFEIGRDRVTDETAVMRPLAEDDPLLSSPNDIGPADFEGWVQERGIYFASKWDERYRPVFAAADPGEDELQGSTLVARHGKGRFVYTGLVFFRQLPAGVPGAYRLLANLLDGPP